MHAFGIVETIGTGLGVATTVLRGGAQMFNVHLPWCSLLVIRNQRRRASSRHAPAQAYRAAVDNAWRPLLLLALCGALVPAEGAEPYPLPQVAAESSPLYAVRPTVDCALRCGVELPKVRLTPAPPKLMPVDEAAPFPLRPGETSREIEIVAAAAPPAEPPSAEPLPPAATDAAAPPLSQPLKLTAIGSLSTEIAAPAGQLPHNYAADALAVDGRYTADPTAPIRVSAPFSSTPRIAGFTHRPLYFEERALEREGRSWGPLQPAVSAAHFYGTLPVLPYKMGAQPPSYPMYTGNGRNIPSDHLTWRQRVRGGVTQALTVTGLNYIIP